MSSIRSCLIVSNAALMSILTKCNRGLYPTSAEKLVMEWNQHTQAAMQLDQFCLERLEWRKDLVGTKQARAKLVSLALLRPTISSHGSRRSLRQ